MRATGWMWTAAAVCCLISPVRAAVRLPAVFSDQMVLQQRSNVTVWGWAEPGERIKVKGSWQRFGGASTVAAEDSRWKVRLKTPRAGGPHTLTVKGDNEIVLKDVLIGEVWVCSGQSNMEWMFSRMNTEEARHAVDTADFPNIRLFTVKQEFAEKPKADCSGQWQVCTPQTARDFSAVAFYFGRELHQKLDVPIGLINTSWGGTPAEAWTSAKALRAHGGFDEALDRLENPDAYLEAARKDYQQKLAEWENSLTEIDPGTKENFQHPLYDDSDWKTMDQPTPWTGTELEDIDGVVWFRRVTNLPPSWARNDLELHLGPIDDIDTVWVNGVRIATSTTWYKPRTYRLPAEVLRVGPNVIAVRVIDLHGEGGFCGKEDDMRIGPPGADVKTCATVARTWKYKVSHVGAVPPPPPSPEDAINPNTPSVLFNGMLNPLIPFRIAGAIWYQGESNCDRAIQYRTLFPAMIRDWRAHWKQGDFPFYYVQIAPYSYGNSQAIGSALLREAQLLTLKAVPNVGMAVTMDIGEENDIHPKNKRDVGKRLSLWALACTYGMDDIVYSGPLYRAMKVQGEAIRISFDYVGSGLVARGGPLTDFEIAGIDRKFVPANAEIQSDNAVLVSSPQVPNPVAVRYAFRNWAQPNLFNAEGLPASSFRTDNWPIE